MPTYSRDQIIKRLRSMCAGSTQTAVAFELGVSTAYLNQVLEGHREPGPKLLAAMNLQATKVYRPAAKTA